MTDHCNHVYHYIQFPFWLVHIFLWASLVCSTAYLSFEIFVVSTLNIMFRFKQLKILATRSLAKKSWTGSSLNLWLFIINYEKIRSKVQEYNRIFKWFLMVVKFIFEAMSGLGIYVTISGKVQDSYLRFLMTVISVLPTLLMVSYASVAGLVHSNARSFYPTLCSIKARKGHMYGRRLNHHVSILTNYMIQILLILQLNILIERISDTRFPIGYYCYDIYAYTNMSVFEVSQVFPNSIDIYLINSFLKFILSVSNYVVLSLDTFGDMK